MISPSGSRNDIIYIRFYFMTTSSAQVGDRLKVTITYVSGGTTKYSSGYIMIIG